MAEVRRIAVIGGGRIGSTLGNTWAAAGHDVTFGLRDGPRAESDAASPKPARAERHAATKTETIERAIRGAEVVVFTIPGSAMKSVVDELGAALNGTIVIDVANSMTGGGPINHEAMLAAAAPDATYVRAFNTLGVEILADPIVGGTQADLFWCGPDGAARRVVESLIGDIGLRPVRMGGAEDAGVVDGMLRAWFVLASKEGRGRRIAFKLLAD